MRRRLCLLASVCVASAVLAAACDEAPTAVPAVTAEPRPGESVEPDPANLPALQGQLVFAQAGEVVRWPPNGGRFQVLAAATAVGALEVAESGSTLAYMAQDPEISTETATVHILDLTGPMPREVGRFPVDAAADFRLLAADPPGRRLAVSGDGSVVAWFDGAGEIAVQVWTVGESATFSAGVCRAGSAEQGGDENRPCEAIALSNAGDWVAFADEDGLRVVATGAEGESPGQVPSAFWRDGRIVIGDEAGARPTLPAEDGVPVAAIQEGGPLVWFEAGGPHSGEFTAVLGRLDTGERFDLSGIAFGGHFFRLAGAPGGEPR